jgi:large subunit ribosomal protein L35
MWAAFLAPKSGGCFAELRPKHAQPEKIPLAHRRRLVLYCASFWKKRINMRRPKGIKTKKAVAKRFKITAGGNVLRMRPGKRHLLQGKKPKRRRNLGAAIVVDPTDAYRILQNLPFSP